jgi:hypothetical protein
MTSAKDPLVVLLVGETPTGGIEKEQFLNAIQLIQQRTRANETREMNLKILGPTFSGSLSSLKRLLTCGEGSCFGSATIMSGTISGREAVDDFRDVISSFQKKETGAARTTFNTFQETDAVMLERFVEFIAGRSYGDRKYDVRHIAELSEDETAYGSLRRSANQSEYPAKSGYCKDLPAGPKNTAPSPNATPPRNTAQLCSMLRLYFPREISQLRAAYQDHAGSANVTERLPFQNLPHNLGVTGAEDDTVASFSQKQTPLSQEALLLSIVAELRKHAIEFVVLNATDPLDTLFLSHYLRSAYPQGRIITINSDALFPREVEDTSLQGILALSTYSVSPSANHQFFQLWQSGTERMFPSSSEIGTYNALHSLMTARVSPPRPDCDPSVSKNECADQLQSSPGKPLYLVQYGWRERGEDKPDKPNKFSKYNAPPVRLSALGHDGFWPVANLGPFDFGDKETKKTIPTLLPQVVTEPPPGKITALLPHLVCVIPDAPPVKQFTTDPANIVVPDSWIVTEVVGLALAFGFCISLWFASVRSPWQQLTQFAPTMAGARVWLIAAAGVFLISVLLFLLWPYVHGFRDWVMTHKLRHATILVAGIVVVFLVTLLDISHRCGLLDAIARHRRIIWADFRSRPVVLTFTAAFVFLAYLCFFRPEHPEEHLAGIRHFQVLRAIQLTSGLSPILPIFFLLAAGLW